MEAIDQRDPAEDTAEALIQGAVQAAIQAQVRYGSSRPDNPGPGGWLLPTELQPVLDLLPRFRCCFVLRILAGLPRQVCARLLHLNASKVDQYTCAALEYLAAAEMRIPNSSYLEPSCQG